jgi:hypothetical protein
MTTAPMNPLAGVSGPGKYSARTDNLDMGSIAYGEGVETAAIKSGAPLAKTGEIRGMPASEVRAAAKPVTGLYDPTQRPDEPITAGIDMGEGQGSEALMMRQPDDNNFRAKIAEYMPVLAYVASLPDASPETRAAIRQLRDYA